MTRFLKSFAAEEQGAVSTDWVMLTAGAVMLGMSAVTAVQASMSGAGDRVSDSVTVENGD